MSIESTHGESLFSFAVNETSVVANFVEVLQWIFFRRS